MKDGYFVEVGAWDAELDSNSKALEDAGWTGICVEPFPQNWNNFEEPKRSRIRALLANQGYRLARTQFVDDWYVLDAGAAHAAQ